MRLQFGPFEVDEANARLLKHGLPVPLREQPFQILLALLDRPGELVSREELHRRLWHESTVVDFEIGLNTAISRLRRALSDSAGSPRFIETVPKRGYRLIVPVPRQPSIAVMPLVNDSPESDSSYFSDGLTDELIGVIARIEGIRVAGRSSVERFRGISYVPQQAAQVLGVDFLLEGSVRKIADRIRIGIRLLNGKDGFQLWSERFDAEWKDIFAVQDKVAERTAEALKLRWASGKANSRPQNSDAHTAYLQGHYLVKNYSPGNLERALQYFNESIESDAGYALAYHGAAVAQILSALMGATQPRHSFASAETLLDRGLALNKDSAMLQTTLAMLRMFQWRWSEAACAHRLALMLEPANPHVHMTFSLHHTFLGNHEAAIREAETALSLDPVDPMMNFRMVQCFYYGRRYEAVIRSSRTALDLAPGSAPVYGYLAWALLALERRHEAWTAAQHARQLGGTPLCEGQFAYTAGSLGYSDEARNVIEDLTDRRNHQYCSALPIAWGWLGLGDVERCMDWLEIAHEEQEPFVASVAVFPAYDVLRDHPRFREILRKLRFTDAS